MTHVSYFIFIFSIFIADNIHISCGLDVPKESVRSDNMELNENLNQLSTSIKSDSLSKSKTFQFFNMNELFKFGKIFYKMQYAFKALNEEKIKNPNLNVYAFEFDEDGKRGFFIADNELIIKIFWHQENSTQKVCLYEVN